MADTAENQAAYPQMRSQIPGVGFQIARMVGIDLYRRRWEVGLHIRSIKTHRKAEHLKCKSPSMVQKEIHTHLIAYNLLQLTMVAALLGHDLPPTRLSFERSRGELSEYSASVRSGGTNLQAKWDAMLQSIREATVGVRLGRQEPRELKRRQEQYKLMTKPRDPSRNRYATAVWDSILAIQT